MPIVVFAIVATPQVARSSLARGHLAFTTRTVWHVALVGLGYYPNAYGLEANDGAIFAVTREKYGVRLVMEDYAAEDEAAKRYFFKIWQQDKAFVIRSFLGRLGESVAGSTKNSGRSYSFLSNLSTEYSVCSALWGWL